MKQRSKWLVIFTALVMLITVGTPVFAGDDDDDDHGNYEYHQKDHDDDDEEDDWVGNQDYQVPISPQTEFWNIWSREARNNPDQPLPINVPSEVLLFENNTESSIYVIPQDGQLLVSCEEIAKTVGSQSIFYPQSKICVLTKGNRELIVRAGSNAAYENKVKTPMPLQALAYENSVYIPISVGANALGYRVSWNEETKAFELQEI